MFQKRNILTYFMCSYGLMKFLINVYYYIVIFLYYYNIITKFKILLFLYISEVHFHEQINIFTFFLIKRETYQHIQIHLSFIL